MKPSINLRYKSLLLTCLLIFSAGVAVPAWGQTYTINYKNGSPQTGIPNVWIRCMWQMGKRGSCLFLS